MSARERFNPFANKRHQIDAMMDVEVEGEGNSGTAGSGVRKFSFKARMPQAGKWGSGKDGEAPQPFDRIEEETFMQCSSCKSTISKQAMVNNLMVCPECGYHLPLFVPKRLASVFDGGRYRELDRGLIGNDPLDFPGYEDKLEGLRDKTHLNEAVVCATGTVGGHKVTVCILDSRFLMGSMGVAVGEKITRAIENATRRRVPLIIFSASGGARMQEGICSLMQMAKTSAALAKHDEAGLLYISVMTHPTTGGVTASFASLGDVIISEPEALIGFAGPRVIRQTVNQELPPGFQHAEAVLSCGFLDAIVPRSDMRSTLIALLDACDKPSRSAFRKLASGADGFDRLDAMNEKALSRSADIPAGERVKLARSQERPDIRAYIDALFEDFMELHGDRLCGDDHSIVGGIAKYRGIPVTVIGHQKGHDLESNLDCNFGMANPEGYRKSMRLAKQAEKFGRPIITFIDTPGAYPGIEAEERGQGEAIAKSLEVYSRLKVPVIAILIGEGGSGGALALAVADVVVMLENAIYSVISPEGFAAILWKDRSRSPEACELVKLTAADLLELGIIEHIIPEGEGGVQNGDNRENVFAEVDEVIRCELARLGSMSGSEIINKRYKRFRDMGEYLLMTENGRREPVEKENDSQETEGDK